MNLMTDRPLIGRSPNQSYESRSEGWFGSGAYEQPDSEQLYRVLIHFFNGVFVYDDSKKVIPIEIKYREHPANADLKGLIEFMEMEDLNIGIVVTKDTFRKGEIGVRKVLLIPAWLFLLLI